jgi:hypothetical protein
VTYYLAYFLTDTCDGVSVAFHVCFSDKIEYGRHVEIGVSCFFVDFTFLGERCENRTIPLPLGARAFTLLEQSVRSVIDLLTALLLFLPTFWAEASRHRDSLFAFFADL